jgi:hypothetical protein
MSDKLSTPSRTFFLLDKSEIFSHIMAMRTQVTQSDIAVQALQLGAGLTAVAKWRDRGIPESWRWRLKDHCESLPEVTAPPASLEAWAGL